MRYITPTFSCKWWNLYVVFICGPIKLFCASCVNREEKKERKMHIHLDCNFFLLHSEQYLMRNTSSEKTDQYRFFFSKFVCSYVAKILCLS